ncbi:hypothetical protein Pelo_14438 [Pelomyxa schiedti]|nr:hypothetical protein Pelo_14438 [Pelomyxa schiedti]
MGITSRPSRIIKTAAEVNCAGECRQAEEDTARIEEESVADGLDCDCGGDGDPDSGGRGGDGDGDGDGEPDMDPGGNEKDRDIDDEVGDDDGGAS